MKLTQYFSRVKADGEFLHEENMNLPPQEEESKKNSFLLIVRGRDTYDDKILNQIEGIAGGKIQRKTDDGRGNTRLEIRPDRETTKRQRSVIEKKIRVLTGGRDVTWMELRV